MSIIWDDITVTMNGYPPFEKKRVRQGDSGRGIRVHVIDNDRQPFDLTGLSAMFRAKKSDGTEIARFDGVGVEGNTVSVELTTNTLAAVGDVHCEITFGDTNGETVGTAPWDIFVWAPAVSEASLISQPDYSAVQAAMTATQGYRDEAEGFANSASASADRAEEKAEEIESVEYNPVRANPDTKTLWNYIGGQWVDSEIGIVGTGDMSRSEYDSDDSVLDAGGIKPYVSNQLKTLDPSGAVAGAGGIPAYHAANPDTRVGQMYTFTSGEKRIGTWINDKPMYRKVLSVNALPNNNSVDIQLGISDMDTVTKLYGIAQNSTATALTLPHVDPAALSSGIRLYLTMNRTIARLNSGDNYSSFSGYIIIEYTKTTD